MSAENIRLYRNEIIENCIGLEMTMSGIISYHYFGKIHINFLLEVLYDENFSFGLKRKIVEKIVVDIDRTRINHLNRMGSIRNYFAHCHPNIIDPATGLTESIDSRRLDRVIDFEALYKEFKELRAPVSEYLNGILEAMSGGPLRSVSELLDDPRGPG